MHLDVYVRTGSCFIASECVNACIVARACPCACICTLAPGARPRFSGERTSVCRHPSLSDVQVSWGVAGVSGNSATSARECPWIHASKHRQPPEPLRELCGRCPAQWEYRLPKSCCTQKYNTFIKITDDTRRRVLQIRDSECVHPHMTRKIAAAVAEQHMGGSRPSSKDWIGAPRHTTTCTRNQVCFCNGKHIHSRRTSCQRILFRRRRT